MYAAALLFSTTATFSTAGATLENVTSLTISSPVALIVIVTFAVAVFASLSKSTFAASFVVTSPSATFERTVDLTV